MEAKKKRLTNSNYLKLNIPDSAQHLGFWLQKCRKLKPLKRTVGFTNVTGRPTWLRGAEHGTDLTMDDAPLTFFTRAVRGTRLL